MNPQKFFCGWLSIVLLGWLACSALAQDKLVIPAVPDGYTIVEGDITISKRALQAIRQAAAHNTIAAPEANYGGRLWPNNGRVLYQFQSTCAPASACNTAPPSGCVSAARQAQVRAAMNVLEGISAVRFWQCTGNSCPTNFNYLNIRDSTNDFGPVSSTNNTCVSTSGNNSQVGMVGNTGQNLNIVSWTGASSQWIIIHELLHALGIYHEQARRDRDTYLKVNCNNVQGGCGKDSIFDTQFSKLAGIDYGPYDFDSLMQYGQCDFSINTATDATRCPNSSAAYPDGGVTVQLNSPYATQLSPSGTPWQSAIGQRTHLSYLDQLTISFLYPPSNWRFVGSPYSFPQDFLIRNGSFSLPYETLDAAVLATPAGGVIWLQPGTYTLRDPLTKRVALRAPLGGVTIKHGVQSAFGDNLASVSAANYGGEVAADSIVAAFGANLAANIAVANTVPLPTTLAGVNVKITDNKNITRDAPLFFVSPNQINYLIPAEASPGLAKVIVYNNDTVTANGEAIINANAPSLFTANATGQGVPSAVVFRLRADGSQSFESLARYDAGQQRYIPVPIDLGPASDQVFLILFGTGFRTRSAPEALGVTIGEEVSDVLFAGAAPGFVGLDQANLRLPRTLAGKGEITLTLLADNRATNTVTINVR